MTAPRFRFRVDGGCVLHPLLVALVPWSGADKLGVSTVSPARRGKCFRSLAYNRLAGSTAGALILMHDSFYWDTSAISDATLYAWQRRVSVRHMRAPDRRCTTCNCFLRVTRAQLVTVCDPCRETREKKRVPNNPYKMRKPGRMRDAQEITEGTARNFW